MYIPIITDNVNGVERSFDIYSRLLKDRVIIVQGEIETSMANCIIAQLLYLDKEDKEKPIYMYINSPGGAVTDGLAIVGTMENIKAPVHTICMGLCASMGAFILSQGEKGHRYIQRRGEVMIHQPLGGFQGQATDFDIHAKRILRMKDMLTRDLANACNRAYDEVARDCERDYYMSSDEALAYGIVDEII